MNNYSPTIRLQHLIFITLRDHLSNCILRDKGQEKIRAFKSLCQTAIDLKLDLSDEIVSKWFSDDVVNKPSVSSDSDSNLWSWSKKQIPKMVIEMLYEEDGVIKIKELRGYELMLSHRRPISIQEYIDGGHRDLLNIRSRTFATPQTLRKGDVLATGFSLLEDPRGIPDDKDHILLYVGNGVARRWLTVSRELPVALCPPKLKKSLMVPLG